MEFLTFTSEQVECNVLTEFETLFDHNGKYLKFRENEKSSTHNDSDVNRDNPCQQILNLDTNIITEYNGEHTYPINPHLINISSNELKLGNGGVTILPAQYQVGHQKDPQLQQHHILPNPDCMETALNVQQHSIPSTSVNVASSKYQGQAYNNYYKVTCKFCGRIFSRHCYLAQHINTHHSGVKPFRCVKCGKRFVSENVLDEHQKRHDGMKPFKCTYCPKSFNYKNDLKRHILSHTGQNLHSCNICGKSFARRDHLNMHFSSH